MTLAQALAALKRSGTAQNRKVYAAHGVGPDMWGVSYAELKKLARVCGGDQALAVQLWGTANHDARVLATLIADPEAFSARELDAWARDLDNYVLTDAFSALAARSPLARGRAAAWKDRRGEWVAAAGWSLIAHLALAGTALGEKEGAACLAQIAAEIHSRPNRVRHTMNQALIGIGVGMPALRQAALETAGTIGAVAVDHGRTSCRTPDAAAYIRKTLARQGRRAGGGR